MKKLNLVPLSSWVVENTRITSPEMHSSHGLIALWSNASALQESLTRKRKQKETKKKHEDYFRYSPRLPIVLQEKEKETLDNDE